jgi:putative DNA methylase
MAEYRKKLIEVALPLEAINKESSREKSIRHGHPSTLHLWWARRPLAACRAVLFASLVDDPSSRPEEFPTEEAQDRERQRLFRIIEELVKWENSNNETVLEAARTEIRKATGGNPPPVLDPFCGGGSIPLEAQRLGLEAHASDLNPVAVLITKALIEIPPKFAGMPPVNPEDQAKLGSGVAWKGAAGLAADVRYYGKWMRDKAEKQIGHLYPKLKLPPDQGGGEATAIAWLWARTVRCPNPACDAQMPLVRSYWISTARKVWLEPLVDQATRAITFSVKSGAPHADLARRLAIGTGLSNDQGAKTKATFKCPVCQSGVAKGEYIDQEADAGRMGIAPLVAVAEAGRDRRFVQIDNQQLRAVAAATEMLANPLIAEKLPTQPARGTFASNAQGRMYGFKTMADYFTDRQAIALIVFGDLVSEAREQIYNTAVATGLVNDNGRDGDGREASAYADAVATYLACGVSRGADFWSSLATWTPSGEFIGHTFTRQAIPMVWDFAEGNPFSGASGNWMGAIDWIARVIDELPTNRVGRVRQLDATAAVNGIANPIICTDPPYYGNIGYADLADFFFVWLRRALKAVYPDLFETLLTPKEHELIASPYRFEGSKERAREFFEEGLAKAFDHMRKYQHGDYPLTIYYAVKQEESGPEARGLGANVGFASTGWETMLSALLHSGFGVNGTWPIRTERGARTVGIGTNALASSTLLACRPRAVDAPVATRTEFVRALRRELPAALKKLQHGNIAPVDLAQAAIGPGMAIYSRYSQVIEPSGGQLTVRAALGLINQALDEVLVEQEGEYDADTRWAVAWFEEFGMSEGPFGTAETLSKAKNSSVGGLVEAGILNSGAGKVRLLTRDELPRNWNPMTDKRRTVWEVTQYLIRALETEGERGAAEIASKVGADGEVARDLAYRLYNTCERKGWAQEALAYNSVVVAWPEIARLAAEVGAAPRQGQLM